MTEIKPEWVGRMAAAQWHYEWPDREFCSEPNDLQNFYYESARAALEAVVPLIAAKALEDAADELRRLDDGRTGGYYEAGRHIIARLHNRATKLRGES